MPNYTSRRSPYPPKTLAPAVVIIKESSDYPNEVIEEVKDLRERVAVLENTLYYPIKRASKPEFISGKGSRLTANQDLEQTFMQLVDEWRSQTSLFSSIIDIVTNPAYQRIIGQGPNVIPLILRELSKQPDHWFWALRSITGNDPIPQEDRGNILLMTRAWLDWGYTNGYIF